jgi:hypothetical protein
MSVRKTKISREERNDRKRKSYYANRTTMLEKQKKYYEDNKQIICEKRKIRHKKKKAELGANPKIKQKIATQKQQKELAKYRECIKSILSGRKQ